MASSPTTRTLARLRELGYVATITERWNAHARIRQDLFGFIDVLALRDGEVLGVQACAGASASARVKKIIEHENLNAVRKSGIRIEVWAWRKLKAGWDCRVIDLS